ncbi:RCC1/BLIP-II protein [Mollisia scopiformis]|uniref:RCC1/BLIP-II protein n=1 Tax=Mollisia scopiformis TaxID=149040 RepID=A0A194XTH9_MOLSC|nr:RCC1/BLIP-II protein [Mollisia scopiformis]KUJ23354.1 RCC1/BLIP-II protein [Mollisia scopiformis]
MAPKRKAAVEAADKLKNSKKAKKTSIKPDFNEAPTQRLDVYVFGSGENGELGLGSVKRNGKMPTNVSRPRLNDLLDAATVGVVQIAVGGMHCIVITEDNRLLTWGVNDDGALGRDTTWTAPVKDAAGGDESESDDDDDDDSGLNPVESTPTAIPADCFEGDPVWVQVAATDSASFALTSTGEVYGWGCFHGSDGPVGFSLQCQRDGILKQKTPLKIPELKNITSLAAGGNHMLALDQTGNVWTWGDGSQYQLGRLVSEKYRDNSLRPAIQTSLHRNSTTFISAGAYHSITIDTEGRVWAWGLNNYGQTGVIRNAGEDGAAIEKPAIVRSLRGQVIVDIEGGTHHSIACNEDGEVMSWGRCDDGQPGVGLENLADSDVIEDKILLYPRVIDGINAVRVAAGIDNSFAIDSDGKVHAWGFSDNYRTGLGTEQTVELATVIENTAVKGKKLSFAACGGQFSVLAGPSDAVPKRRRGRKAKKTNE